ncbi:uncharacterized protein METZ01_LOCUS304385, partial [marine metagenome]
GLLHQESSSIQTLQVQLRSRPETSTTMGRTRLNTG